MAQSANCYQVCNSKFNSWDPKRLFCKKGCDSDENNLQSCKKETCSELCIRSELGDDDSKLGKWSSFFSRAPKDPQECLSACITGCNNKDDFDADGDDD